MVNPPLTTVPSSTPVLPPNPIVPVPLRLTVPPLIVPPLSAYVPAETVTGRLETSIPPVWLIVAAGELSVSELSVIVPLSPTVYGAPAAPIVASYVVMPLLLGTPADHFVASNQLPLAAPVQLLLTCTAPAGCANGSAAMAAGSRMIVRRANRARTEGVRTVSVERPVMSGLRVCVKSDRQIEQIIRRRRS